MNAAVITVCFALFHGVLGEQYKPSPSLHRKGPCPNIIERIRSNPLSLDDLEGIWYQFAIKGNVIVGLSVEANVTYQDQKTILVTFSGKRKNDSSFISVTGKAVRPDETQHPSKFDISFPEEAQFLLGWVPPEQYILSTDSENYAITYANRYDNKAETCIEYMYIFTRKYGLKYDKDDKPVRDAINADLRKYGHTPMEFWYIDMTHLQ